jgi:hypothetical protein
MGKIRKVERRGRCEERQWQSRVTGWPPTPGAALPIPAEDSVCDGHGSRRYRFCLFGPERGGRLPPVLPGRVSEWFMDAVLKTAVGAILPWVRIPPLPRFCKSLTTRSWIEYTCPMNLSGNLNQAERTQKRLNLRGLGPGFTSESVPNLGAREQRKPWSARCEGGQVQGVKLSRVWTFRLRGEGVKSGQVYWALKV